MNGAIAVQVFAVIPAAGQSTRMGRPKQLLPIGGRTMLESVIETVLEGDIDGLCVVTSSAIDAELALREDPRFLTTINDDPRTQMLDSVLMGVSALRKSCEVGPADGILVCPGDAAGLTAEDARCCAGAYRRQPEVIVVAAFGARRGHPVVFPASLENELHGIHEDGIRAILKLHADHVRVVECASPGVLADVDTPADYARLLGQSEADAKGEPPGLSRRSS